MRGKGFLGKKGFRDTFPILKGPDGEMQRKVVKLDWKHHHS